MNAGCVVCLLTIVGAVRAERLAAREKANPSLADAMQKQAANATGILDAETGKDDDMLFE